MSKRLTLKPNDEAHRATPAAGPEAEDFNALLLAVGRHKDREAFIRLFRYFAPRMKSFLIKGGTNPDQAEELVQEAMLNVWNKASGFDPRQAGASTWIFTIVRNKRIDSLRRTARIDLDPSDPAFIPDTGGQKSDDLVLESDRIKKVAEAIETLPREQSDLVYKAFFEDKTHMEIASETKLPLGTVKSRIRLALEKLKPYLARDLI